MPIFSYPQSGTFISRPALSGEVNSGVIQVGTIASGAITSGCLASGVVTSGHIASGTLGGSGPSYPRQIGILAPVRDSSYVSSSGDAYRIYPAGCYPSSELSASTATVPAYKIYCVPYVTCRGGSVIKIGVKPTSSPSASIYFRLGVYDSKIDTWPGSLIYDAGLLQLSAYYSGAFGCMVSTGGWTFERNKLYYLAFAYSSGSQDFRGNTYPSNIWGLDSELNSSAWSAVTYSSGNWNFTTSGLPNPFPTSSGLMTRSDLGGGTLYICVQY